MTEAIYIPNEHECAQSMSRQLIENGYTLLFGDAMNGVTHGVNWMVLDRDKKLFVFSGNIDALTVDRVKFSDMIPRTYPYVGRFVNPMFEYLVLFLEPKKGMVIKVSESNARIKVGYESSWEEDLFTKVEI
jgi:hypothetical protein